MIEGGTSLASTLLKELLVHRNQINVLEAEKEKEVEVAKARAKHGQQPQPSESPSPPSNASGSQSGQMRRVDEQVDATPAEIENALDQLIDEEMCAVCRELLVELKERPTEQQVRGIMEYGTFKHNLDDGAGVEELKSVIRETDVLHSIFQEKYTGAGGQA